MKFRRNNPPAVVDDLPLGFEGPEEGSDLLSAARKSPVSAGGGEIEVAEVGGAGDSAVSPPAAAEATAAAAAAMSAVSGLAELSLRSAAAVASEGSVSVTCGRRIRSPSLCTVSCNSNDKQQQGVNRTDKSSSQNNPEGNSTRKTTQPVQIANSQTLAAPSAGRIHCIVRARRDRR